MSLEESMVEIRMKELWDVWQVSQVQPRMNFSSFKDKFREIASEFWYELGPDGRVNMWGMPLLNRQKYNITKIINFGNNAEALYNLPYPNDFILYLVSKNIWHSVPRISYICEVFDRMRKESGLYSIREKNAVRRIEKAYRKAVELWTHPGGRLYNEAMKRFYRIIKSNFFIQN